MEIVNIISKAGEATGIFKICYNVKDDYTTYYLNLGAIYRFENIGNNDKSENIEDDIQNG